MSFYDSPTFTFVVLPILIVIARVCDVTIGTIRIIVLSRGHRYLAPLLGFFEVLIWITVIGKVMQNLHNPVCYLAYAGGFALGNFVGIIVEEKLAMGKVVIRIITSQDATQLIAGLRDAGFGVTNIPAQGGTGLVHVIFTVVKRGHIEDVEQMILKFNPRAFYSIEDIRYVSEGVFPGAQGLPFYQRKYFGLPEIFSRAERRQDKV
jgi:uncharacterized protein YebE (UPF0316 family)